MFRAMQKEAAELGADAILVGGDGIKQENGAWKQSSRALAIKWNKGSSKLAYAVTPTSAKPTTPAAEQIVPKDTKK